MAPCSLLIRSQQFGTSDAARGPSTSSFDHLIGERQEFWRKLDTERLGGLQINDQLEFGWLLDGQLAGMSAFEHLAREYPGLAIDLGNAGAVAQQASFRGELAQRTDRWHARLCRQGRHPLHLCQIEVVAGNDHDAKSARPDRSERLIDFGLIARGQKLYPLVDGADRHLGVPALGVTDWIVRID